MELINIQGKDISGSEANVMKAAQLAMDQFGDQVW